MVSSGYCGRKSDEKKTKLFLTYQKKNAPLTLEENFRSSIELNIYKTTILNDC